jgi:hypothetical protein
VQTVPRQTGYRQRTGGGGIEQVWHVFDSTHRGIAHAEGKAALTLASAGALAGALFAVGQGVHHLSALSACALAFFGAFDFAAALCSALCLWARLGSAGEPSSLIYFHDLNRTYSGDADGYVAALLAAVHDEEKLSADLARQVWATAGIADHKFRWANSGVAGLIGALVAFAAACGSLTLH